MKIVYMLHIDLKAAKKYMGDLEGPLIYLGGLQTAHFLIISLFGLKFLLESELQYLRNGYYFIERIIHSTYFRIENQKIFCKYNIFVHKTYWPNDICQLAVHFITGHKVTSRDITTDPTTLVI